MTSKATRNAHAEPTISAVTCANLRKRSFMACYLRSCCMCNHNANSTGMTLAARTPSGTLSTGNRCEPIGGEHVQTDGSCSDGVSGRRAAGGGEEGGGQ